MIIAIKNIRKFVPALLRLLAVGCTKTVELGGTKTGGTAYDPSKVIAVTTEVSALSGPAGTRSGSGGAATAGTRGTPIDTHWRGTGAGCFMSILGRMNTQLTVTLQPCGA